MEHGFCGEEWSKHECALTNEWGLGLLPVRQDSRADPFGWRSMVALLSPTHPHVKTEKYK